MKQKYEKTFQTEAVKLALSTDKSIAQTARELGIKESTLYKWIYQTKKQSGHIENQDVKLNTSQLIDELNRLRKEVGRLREEREILKKAAVFFAKEEQKR